MYFYQARYYDGALGRFIQADSIVPDFTDPQALNRYSYVLNNSLKYTDPSGHAHYNPGDPSYSTHPKVCYGYSYPQVETQPTSVSNPYAELQPEVDTGNEFINFLVSPWLTPGFPRVQVKPWENSIYRGRISFWFADIEIEYGQTLNGRLGSAGPWLVKSNAVRLYDSGKFWVTSSGTELSYGLKPYQFPTDHVGTKGEMRSIGSLKWEAPGVLRQAATVEWTASAKIPGAETRGTTYLRIATNTYFGRAAALVVEFTGAHFGSKVKVPNPKPVPNTCLLYTSPSPRDRTRSRMPSSA